MFTIAFWLIFGTANPCQSVAVESGDLRLIRPDWSFINTRPEVVCSASKDVETTMELMGINPFDAVEHESAPTGLALD